MRVTRCVGFQAGNTDGQRFEPGNEVGLRHGAYASPVKLEGRVSELAPQLADLVPAYREADGPAVQLLAVTLTRIERAAATVEADENGDEVASQRLRDDLRKWVGTSVRLLDALGMTPTARARLGLDIAQTRRAVTLPSCTGWRRRKTLSRLMLRRSSERGGDR